MMKLNLRFIRLGQVIRRIPFTLGMLVLLLLVAWGTHSYFQELAREWVARLGFAPRDFWFLRWERLILSTLEDVRSRVDLPDRRPQPATWTR